MLLLMRPSHTGKSMVGPGFGSLSDRSRTIRSYLAGSDRSMNEKTIWCGVETMRLLSSLTLLPYDHEMAKLTTISTLSSYMDYRKYSKVLAFFGSVTIRFTSQSTHKAITATIAHTTKTIKELPNTLPFDDTVSSIFYYIKNDTIHEQVTQVINIPSLTYTEAASESVRNICIR